MLRFRSPLWRIGSWLAALAMVAAWWLCLWRHHNPLPFADDFDSVLSNLSKWVENPSLAQIFSVHNESSQLLLRLVVLIDYWLHGSVSFSRLTLWSLSIPVIYLGALATYCRAHVRSPQPLALLLLPCVVIMLQPGSWGSYLWVTVGLTHGAMPLLTLLSVAALEARRFVLCALIALGTFFCGGAGLFIPLIVLGSLLFRVSSRHRAVMLALLALAAVIASAIIISNPLLALNVSQLLESHHSPLGFLQYALVFLGNWGHFRGVMLSTMCGGVTLGLGVALFRMKAEALTSVFLMAIAAAISSSILRYADGGIQHALLSRYEVYSTSAWTALYCLALIRYERHRGIIMLSGLALAVVIAVRTYSSVPRAVEAFHLKQSRDFALAQFDQSIVLAEYPPRHATDAILAKAHSLGIYEPDWAQFMRRQMERNVELPDASVHIVHDVTLRQENESLIALRGAAVIHSRGFIVPQRICLLVASAADHRQNIRLCYPKQFRKDAFSRLRALHPGIPRVGDMGFTLVAPKSEFPDPPVSLGIMVFTQQRWHLAWLSADLLDSCQRDAG